MPSRKFFQKRIIRRPDEECEQAAQRRRAYWSKNELIVLWIENLRFWAGK
jgi:hypothetical protein